MSLIVCVCVSGPWRVLGRPRPRLFGGSSCNVGPSRVVVSPEVDVVEVCAASAIVRVCVPVRDRGFSGERGRDSCRVEVAGRGRWLTSFPLVEGASGGGCSSMTRLSGVVSSGLALSAVVDLVRPGRVVPVAGGVVSGSGVIFPSLVPVVCVAPIVEDVAGVVVAPVGRGVPVVAETNRGSVRNGERCREGIRGCGWHRTSWVQCVAGDVGAVAVVAGHGRGMEDER